MNISNKIKSARKDAKLTQKELAKEIHKSVSAVQKYELGLATPPIDVLKDISVALNIPMGELMGYEDMGGGFYGREASDDVVLKLAANIQQHSTKTRLDEAFNKLNPAGQQVAAERVEELSQIPAYQKDKD